MDQEQFEALKTDYILGMLEDKQIDKMDEFLANNPKLIKELDELKTLLDFDTVELPESSEEKMDKKFYAFLKEQNANQSQIQGSLTEKLKSLFSLHHLQGKLVYGLAILALGFFVGKGFYAKPAIENLNTNQVNAETENVRSQLVLELIDEPSANKRLKAVNEASKLNDATDQIIKALFITLNNDDNVNVRLAAIESLMRYADKPIVREGLIKSITNQDSPLVQVALADVMVSLQDKNSIDPLKELLNQPDVNSAVKEKLNASIKEII